MNKDIKELHLMQRLIERLNTEVFETSYTVIANYLLNNHRNIKDITIDDLCKIALVSKSTIKRFCNSIGYKNFTELKKSYCLQDYSMNYSLNLESEMTHIINSLTFIEDSLIKQMNKEIMQYNNIFILGPYYLYSCLYEYQREMIYQNKTIFLLPNIDLHFKEAKKRMENGLIIIIDFDDVYLKSIIPFLNELNTKIILLTNQNNQFIKENIKIIFSPVQNKSLEKYQLLLFFDKVVKKYQEYRNV